MGHNNKYLTRVTSFTSTLAVISEVTASTSPLTEADLSSLLYIDSVKKKATNIFSCQECALMVKVWLSRTFVITCNKATKK